MRTTEGRRLVFWTALHDGTYERAWTSEDPGPSECEAYREEVVRYVLET